MRVYDPRVGRFLSVDPMASQYPWYTPYQFAGNTPIQALDLDGLEPKKPGSKEGETRDAPVQGSKDKTVRNWKWNGTKWIDNSSLQEAVVTAFSKHYHKPLAPFLQDYYEDKQWDETLDIGKDLLNFLFLDDLKKKAAAFGPPDVSTLTKMLKKKAPELYDAAELLVKDREDQGKLMEDATANLAKELAGEEKVGDALILLNRTLKAATLTPIVYDWNLRIVNTLDGQVNNYRGFEDAYKNNWHLVKIDHLYVVAVTYKQLAAVMEQKFFIPDDFKQQRGVLVGGNLDDPALRRIYFGGDKPAFYIYYNDAASKGFLHLDEIGVMPIIQQ